MSCRRRRAAGNAGHPSAVGRRRRGHCCPLLAAANTHPATAWRTRSWLGIRHFNKVSGKYMVDFYYSRSLNNKIWLRLADLYFGLFNSKWKNITQSKVTHLFVHFTIKMMIFPHLIISPWVVCTKYLDASKEKNKSGFEKNTPNTTAEFEF